MNSGRLSTAVAYPESALNSRDEDEWTGGVRPGFPPLDAPFGDGWLLDEIGGKFALLVNGADVNAPKDVRLIDISKRTDVAVLIDRYELTPGGAYLFRPDQYVAARWKRPAKAKIEAALARAKGK